MSKITEPEIIDIQVLLTIAIILVMFITREIAKRLIKRYVKLHEYSFSRKAYTMKVFNFIIILSALLMLFSV